jgi:DMSO/TMAO reductase YedYZ molybdopterin-dependent catalytic subunit
MAARLRRREFIRSATHGSVIMAFGGVFAIVDRLTHEALAAPAKGGRPRLPPGQRIISALKPMGGQPGDPSRSQLKLRVHGEVERPLVLSFRDLAKMPNPTLSVDVHCVTGWSVLDAKFTGVRVADLAKRAGVKPGARYVIFEAAHGYTANVLLKEALDPNVLVAHRLSGAPLPRPNGGPLRALVPSLYFWKSAKWLTGIRFVRRDEPGYWETRGYHNRADPWKEQRYA